MSPGTPRSTEASPCQFWGVQRRRPGGVLQARNASVWENCQVLKTNHEGASDHVRTVSGPCQDRVRPCQGISTVSGSCQNRVRPCQGRVMGVCQTVSGSCQDRVRTVSASVRDGGSQYWSCAGVHKNLGTGDSPQHVRKFFWQSQACQSASSMNSTRVDEALAASQAWNFKAFFYSCSPYTHPHDL